MSCQYRKKNFDSAMRMPSLMCNIKRDKFITTILVIRRFLSLMIGTTSFAYKGSHSTRGGCTTPVAKLYPVTPAQGIAPTTVGILWYTCSMCYALLHRDCRDDLAQFYLRQVPGKIYYDPNVNIDNRGGRSTSYTHHRNLWKGFA